MTAPTPERVVIDGETDPADSERYLVALVEARLREADLAAGFMPQDFQITVDSWYPDPDLYDEALLGGLVVISQLGGDWDEDKLDFIATVQLACAAITRPAAFALQRRVRNIFDDVDDNPAGFTDGVVVHDIMVEDGPRELPQDSLEQREVLLQYTAHLRRPRWTV